MLHLSKSKSRFFFDFHHSMLQKRSLSYSKVVDIFAFFMASKKAKIYAASVEIRTQDLSDFGVSKASGTIGVVLLSCTLAGCRRNRRFRNNVFTYVKRKDSCVFKGYI